MAWQVFSSHVRRPSSRLTEQQVRDLINSHITGRDLGVFGEPRVNVLKLNLALDAVAPLKSS